MSLISWLFGPKKTAAAPKEPTLIPIPITVTVARPIADIKADIVSARKALADTIDPLASAATALASAKTLKATAANKLRDLCVELEHSVNATIVSAQHDVTTMTTDARNQITAIEGVFEQALESLEHDALKIETTIVNDIKAAVAKL